jgi:hypothetical protein
MNGRESVSKRALVRDPATKTPDVPRGLQQIELPKPTPAHAMSIITALEKRKTNRSISDKKL